MRNFMDDENLLAERYCKPGVLNAAHEMLSEGDLSEEAYLGAQCVLLLNGML